jgi:hypothetical protein
MTRPPLSDTNDPILEQAANEQRRARVRKYVDEAEMLLNDNAYSDHRSLRAIALCIMAITIDGLES